MKDKYGEEFQQKNTFSHFSGVDDFVVIAFGEDHCA